MGNKVDTAGWWASVSGIVPSVVWTITNFIGGAIILLAICQIIWQAYKGSNFGQGLKSKTGNFIAGAFFMAPGLLLPLILRIIDALLNPLLTWISNNL